MTHDDYYSDEPIRRQVQKCGVSIVAQGKKVYWGSYAMKELVLND